MATAKLIEINDLYIIRIDYDIPISFVSQMANHYEYITQLIDNMFNGFEKNFNKIYCKDTGKIEALQIITSCKDDAVKLLLSLDINEFKTR